MLLVTGPFKANGVPLRRVNARYVIATSQKVDVSGVDGGVLEKVGAEGYFTKGKAAKKEKGEEAFFKQGEKPEVSLRPGCGEDRGGLGFLGTGLTDCRRSRSPATGRRTRRPLIRHYCRRSSRRRTCSATSTRPSASGTATGHMR